MAKSHHTPPSFFLVPDEKVNYESTVRLGNILYLISSPDNVLSSHPPSPPPSTKTLHDYHISHKASKSHKLGFFTKILDLLGFGVNASSRRAKSDQEAYTISSMAMSTFAPSKEYLKAVEGDGEVVDCLRNTPDRCAFLITGVVVATGVEFTSSTTREAEQEGSAGLASSGLSLGPSASRSRKNVLEVSYTDAGPVVLAYRVQKLAMLECGKMEATAHTEGAYFGADGEGQLMMESDFELDEVDTEDFERVDGVEDVDGVEYALWVA